MVKDNRGRDLEVGDVITLHPDITPKQLFATIKSISEGGLAVPTNMPGVPKGAQAIQGGTLALTIEINMNFNPTRPIPVTLVDRPLKVSGNA